MNGSHCLKTWSTTQNKVSPSSGEAEYYALVKCGCETLGLQSVMADLGIKTTCLMKTDSTAAIGITIRRGHGKVKHLQTCELWLQEVVKDKRIEIQSGNAAQPGRLDDQAPGQQNGSGAPEEAQREDVNKMARVSTKAVKDHEGEDAPVEAVQSTNTNANVKPT